MAEVLKMTFASSLTDICEINSSFDKGILRICYTGENRNKTSISKEAIKSAIKTMYNCPVVCHYDRETDSFGGHDIEIAYDADGTPKLVNLTQPVGVIPESAKVWFQEHEDEDGDTREYLYSEVLLWKRQEAYSKIKRDGITGHSMEIKIKDGQKIEGIYHILDFEFEAFALIGKTPCFEGAALETFTTDFYSANNMLKEALSARDFKQQMFEMMQDLKETYMSANTFNEDGDIKNSMGGGEQTLDERMELVAKYGIDVDTLDFSIEDFTIEELTEKFEAMKQAEPETVVEPEVDNANNFELTNNLMEELVRQVSEETVTHEWGESRRYIYVDCDIEAREVFCLDSEDWLLYGFNFAMNGDNVVVDYESKKRKKYAITDFDEGEQPSPFAGIFTEMEGKINELSVIEGKYNEATEEIASMSEELTTLRKFKADIDDANARAERNAVFARFDDLNGVEAFEALRENCKDIAVDDLEEKCFAIRGRQGTVAKFDLDHTTPVIPVVRHDEEEYEPYGGLFEKYGTRD